MVTLSPLMLRFFLFLVIIKFQSVHWASQTNQISAASTYLWPRIEIFICVNHIELFLLTRELGGGIITFQYQLHYLEHPSKS